MPRAGLLAVCFLIIGAFAVPAAPSVAAPVPSMAAAPVTTLLAARPTAKTMTTTTGANVRAGTSTKTRILKTLKKGTKVTVTSTSGGWSKISTGGYVSSKLLKTAPAAKKPATPAVQQVPKTAGKSVGTLRYTTAALNVRASKSTKSKVIKTLKKGTAVTVKSTSGGWSALSTGGHVSAKYLSAAAPKSAPASKKPAKSAGGSSKLQYAQSVARPYGVSVIINDKACGGVKNLLGCYSSSKPNQIAVTNRALSRNNTWIKHITLHEVSHREIHRICGSAIPPIVGGRVEQVTDAYALSLGAPNLSSGSYKANAKDKAIAKKIKAGTCR